MKKKEGRRKRRGRKEKEEKEKKRKKKKEKRKKRNRRKKKEEVEIEEIEEQVTEEKHGDDELKSSKGNEWGKLGWHWNNRNEEECKEKRWRKNWRIVEEIREKGEMSRILRKSSQWCNWNMKGKRGVRKQKEMKKEEKRGGKSIEIQEKEEQLMIN